MHIYYVELYYSILSLLAAKKIEIVFNASSTPCPGKT